LFALLWAAAAATDCARGWHVRVYALECACGRTERKGLTGGDEND
jgi:hypothetical protein